MPEQRERRRLDVIHELAMRKAEMEALRVQREQLQDRIEQQVTFLTGCYLHCMYYYLMYFPTPGRCFRAR
jgi:hypothetical protein